MRVRSTAAAALLLVLLVHPAAVLGHAELVSTSPEAGSTITEQPLEITATFDEELVVDGSAISLRTSAGERIAVGRVDPADPKVLRLSPPPSLAPDEYEVRWTAVADDGHVERGSFTFTLLAPSPSPSPSPSPVPSPSSTPSPSPSASPSPSPSPAPSPSPEPDSADASSAVVPIVAALLVLAALGLWLTRRRSR